VVSKILQKVQYKRVEHLKCNSISVKEQLSFRKDLFTYYILQTIYNKINFAGKTCDLTLCLAIKYNKQKFIMNMN